MDDPGSWCLFVAVISVLLTLFLSAINQALRNIAWVKLDEAFSKKGHPQRTQIMRQHLAQLIFATATLRLFVNLVLMLCILSYWYSPDAPHSIGTLLKAFAVSALILSIFSVAIPHAWGKHAGTPMLVYCYAPIRLIEWTCWPLTTLLQFIDPVVRRLAGLSKEDSQERLEEQQEELLNVVEEREKAGVVDEEEKEMIASVLEFRDTTSGEIMTPRTEVIGIEATSNLSQAVEIVIQHGHSRYPVYEESIDNIIGILYAKDLLREINHPDNSVDIRQRLRKPFFVPESKSLRDLLHNFQNQKVHLAVVLDEYGGTAGLVTFEDILEELVGEIVDEHELPKAQPIKQISEYVIEVDARIEVDELNDQFDLNIPEDEDYETLGGFIFARLGYIPKAGEAFSHENLNFTIIDAEQRKINRVRIVITPKPLENENGKNKKNKQE